MAYQDMLNQLFSGGLLAQDVGLPPDIQKRAQQQALLNAGVSILAGSGRRRGPKTTLAELAAGGIQAGQQGYQGALQSGMARQDYQGQQAARQAKQAMRKELSALPADQSPESFVKRAQIFEKYGDYDNAQKYYSAAEKFTPKPKDLPSAVQEYEYARGQGYGGTFADFQRDMKRAGASNVSVNTGAPPSAGITSAPLYPELPTGLKAPSGFAFDAKGTLVPIPGGEKDPKSSVGATEGERKAGYLLKRLENAEKIMSDPALAGAQTPEVLPAVIGTVAGETAANLARSPERQRYESAMVDAVDAALTLATGAAYTEEQIKAQRKAYIPQFGDAPGTIQQKAIARQQLIEAARMSAGRMGGEPPLLRAPPSDADALRRALEKYR